MDAEQITQEKICRRDKQLRAHPRHIQPQQKPGLAPGVPYALHQQEQEQRHGQSAYRPEPGIVPANSGNFKTKGPQMVHRHQNYVYPFDMSRR